MVEMCSFMCFYATARPCFLPSNDFFPGKNTSLMAAIALIIAAIALIIAAIAAINGDGAAAISRN